MDEAVAKVMSFAAELCLKSLVCLCHLRGDYIFRMSNVVSMNQAGVSVKGDVMDDAGYYLRQAFLDMNLSWMQDVPQKLDARLSRWWSPTRCGIRFCLKTHNVFWRVPRWLTGAFSWIKLMPRSRMPGSNLKFWKMHTHLWVISLPELGGLCLGGCFRLWSRPFGWMACTSICTSENIALPVPCPAWFLVDAALGPLKDQMGCRKFLPCFVPQCSVLECMFSENVSNFKAHKFWKLIACAMEWLNFGIQMESISWSSWYVSAGKWPSNHDLGWQSGYGYP